MNIENNNLKLTGFRIKKMRLNNDWTQKDLAKKLGLKNDTAIANYEAGYSVPKDEIKLKMCGLFNCTMDYLMGKSDFKTKEDELENYLNVEIKNDLIKKLKELELDKSDLEKAITAFVENYMIVTDNYSINIYDMEDSLIYYAYEIIAKYYFSLINAELSFLTHNSNLLTEKQDYLEQAEENAWNKMRNILEDIDENEIISKLTSTEKVEKLLSKLNDTPQYYMCPVYGQISAGQPNWAEENIEGRIPIDTNLMDIVNPEEHFFLRVNGESMNKIVKNGAFALIHKQDTIENGEIAVVLVNGFDATIKKFTKQDDLIILEPQSDDETFKTQVYDKNTSIKILGKYIGKMEINK